jgi:hypothetical protein
LDDRPRKKFRRGDRNSRCYSLLRPVGAPFDLAETVRSVFSSKSNTVFENVHPKTPRAQILVPTGSLKRIVRIVIAIVRAT